MQQLPLGVRWHDRSTFATFLAGPNAQLVRRLQQFDSAIASTLWLWGARGSGRSHLLQACCAHAGERGLAAAYFPMSDTVTPEALLGCETLDLVCIDDVQAAAEQKDWERALFNLYNGLQEHGGCLLLSADRIPTAVGWTLADLKSRLSSGLAFELKPLSDDEQREVLQLRARTHGLDLPMETARFLLRRYPRDLRTLCDLLDTLDRASLAAGRRLTIPFIKKIIS